MSVRVWWANGPCVDGSLGVVEIEADSGDLRAAQAHCTATSTSSQPKTDAIIANLRTSELSRRSVVRPFRWFWRGFKIKFRPPPPPTTPQRSAGLLRDAPSFCAVAFWLLYSLSRWQRSLGK